MADFNMLYTVLILPIGLAFQRIYSIGGRVSVLESMNKNQDKRIERICKSNDNLTKEVNQMIGMLKEHLRKTNKS